MLAFLREFVQEIVILLILATVIDLALPNSQLKRYVDYTVGLILLLLLLTPVIRFLDSEVDINSLLAGAELTSGKAMVTTAISDNSAWLAYRLVLEERVKQLAVEIDTVQWAAAYVTLDQNPASSTYGSPLMIEVQLKLKHTSGSTPTATEQVTQTLMERLRLTYGLDTTLIRIHLER